MHQSAMRWSIAGDRFHSGSTIAMNHGITVGGIDESHLGITQRLGRHSHAPNVCRDW